MRRFAASAKFDVEMVLFDQEGSNEGAVSVIGGCGILDLCISQPLHDEIQAGAGIANEEIKENKCHGRSA